MKKKLLLVILLFCSLTSSADVSPELRGLIDMIRTNPDSIYKYDYISLVSKSDAKELMVLTNLLGSVNYNGIRRSTVKKHYLPLSCALLKKISEEHPVVENISCGRASRIPYFRELCEKARGMDIHKVMDQMRQILKSFYAVPMDLHNMALCYGEMHFLERKLFGKEIYMNEIDPCPPELLKEIRRDCREDTGDLYIDFLNTLLYRVQHHQQLSLQEVEADKDLKYFYFALFSCVEYWGTITGLVFELCPVDYDMERKMERFNMAFRQRFGDMPASLYAIVQSLSHQIGQVSHTMKFKEYRDSLAIVNPELSKYFPHQCPEILRKSKDFKAYDDAFYDYLNVWFDHLMYLLYDQPGVFFLNNMGVNSASQFLNLYLDETLKRYYNESSIDVMTNIEKVLSLEMDYAREKDIAVMLKLIDVYTPINGKKVLPLVRNYLEPWYEEHMAIDHNATELVGTCEVAATLAWFYSEYPHEIAQKKAKTYLDYLEKKLVKIDVEKHTNILYNVASALCNLGSYEKSVQLINGIDWKNNEYHREFESLLMKDYFMNEDFELFLNIATKRKVLSFVQYAQLLIGFIHQRNLKDSKETLDLFTGSMKKTFEDLVFIDLADQEWAYNHIYNEIDAALFIAESDFCIADFVKDSSLNPLKGVFAGMLYNWSLGAKGVLLRSARQIAAQVKAQLSPEKLAQLKQYANLDKMDEDVNQEDYIRSILDQQYAKMLNSFCMEMIREKETSILPDFSFEQVRSQLKSGECAIEFWRFSDISNYAVLLKKDWEYPKFFELGRVSKKDSNQQLYECFWKEMEPYLTPGAPVYFSLDKDLNQYNIELLRDERGTVMADKYQLYRVSTTLNLCKDLYSKDIRSGVAFGNLNYSQKYDRRNMLGKDYFGAIMPYWTQLPETLEEINAIPHALPLQKFKTYEENAGTKSAFQKLSRMSTDLLHMATHAFYWPYKTREDDQDFTPMERSGLVLSGSSVDYYYRRNSKTIFANEIAIMDLSRVKLLVLSACETGSGHVGTDGIWGLQRAFKQAGVGIIIMTLTTVNSRDTALFMKAFYQAFSTGVSARKAFRSAQKYAEKNFSTQDWKSFIMLD